MAKSVLHIIEDSMSTFSKGQKRIAAFILDNYDRAAFMTAALAGVVLLNKFGPAVMVL